MSNNISFIKLNADAVAPTKGSTEAAGYDLYSIDENIIPVGDSKVFSTGIAVAIPSGYFGGIYARSGLAFKRGIRPSNCVGVIDADFRGEIKVKLHNDSNEPQKIEKGERIAQLIIQPYLDVVFEETDNLNDTERGQNGFGSSGRF